MNVVMVDDGMGTPDMIPSIMISDKDGKRLIKYIEQA